MTERLDGEHIPTRSRALKYLWRFVCIMARRSPSDSMAMFSAQQCINVPLTWAMGDKLYGELDDPHWVFAMIYYINVLFLKLIILLSHIIHCECFS